MAFITVLPFSVMYASQRVVNEDGAAFPVAWQD